MESKLPRPIFRRTEEVLFNHRASQQLLSELRKSIIESAPANDNTPVSSGAGNPTERKGIALVDDGKVRWLEQITAAVEDVLADLDADHRRVFAAKYIQKDVEKKGVDQVARELNLGRTTFFEYRDEIVQKAAYRLGYWWGEAV